MEQRSAEQRDPRYALSVQILLGNAVQLERSAARALELARRHALSLHEHFGALFSGWARSALDPAAGGAALGERLNALERLDGRQLGVARAFAMSLVADACARSGQRLAQGRALIEAALALLEEGGERFCEPEPWRVRAALGPEPAQRLRWLAYSFELTLQQGALAWVRNALADLEAMPGALPQARGTRRRSAAQLMLRLSPGALRHGRRAPARAR